MIRELNVKGLKNFFVTPVTIVDGVRPAAELAISAESLLQFLQEVDELVASLDDAHVEVVLLDAKYVKSIRRWQPWREFGFGFDDRQLTWQQDSSNSRMAVSYWPLSLTGIREFILSTNGDVIAPESMAFGRIPAEKVFGNVTRQSAAEIWAQAPMSSAFSVYVDKLLAEREILKDCVDNLGSE